MEYPHRVLRFNLRIYAEIVTYVAGSLEAVRIAQLSQMPFLLDKCDDAFSKFNITFIT